MSKCPYTKDDFTCVIDETQMKLLWNGKEIKVDDKGVDEEKGEYLEFPAPDLPINFYVYHKDRQIWRVDCEVLNFDEETNIYWENEWFDEVSFNRL